MFHDPFSLLVLAVRGNECRNEGMKSVDRFLSDRQPMKGNWKFENWKRGFQEEFLADERLKIKFIFNVEPVRFDLFIYKFN